MKQHWIPGPPQGEIEPDRLYAVLMQPTAGYSVGIVIRGEDCNWKKTTIGHMPLPVTMNSAEARRLQRLGWYEIPTPVSPLITDPIYRVKAMAEDWLREPAPDNGEPEPEEVALARNIMEMVLNHPEGLQQKVAGYQALLEQIAFAIPLMDPARRGTETIEEQALSDIDMLISTFGDKPEEVVTQPEHNAATLPILQELEKLRTKYEHTTQPTDWMIRTCQAVVAQHAGFKTRLEWTALLKEAADGK